MKKINDGLTNAQRYYQKNKDKCRESARKYWSKNKDKKIAIHKKYRERNKEKINIRQRQQFHHINKENVIQIPKRIYKSIWHNVWTGEGMDAINELAFEYVYVNMGILPQYL